MNTQHTFSYDPQGRLIGQSTEPGPQAGNLARVELPNGFFVNYTTAAGDLARFQVETLPTDAERRTNTDTAGLVETKLITNNGVIETTTT